MNVNYVLVGLVLVMTQLTSVLAEEGFLAAIGIAASLLTSITNIADKAEMWMVEVHNEGKHHAHLWCGSKGNKIWGEDGIWVPPGEKVSWSFRRNRSTLFWCNMDWNEQRVGWDVFVNNWKDAPNPTKWSLRNDGVYDQWKNRIWREYNS